MTRTYDVVIFGATGSTGSEAAKYLAALETGPKFALAGRNRATLTDLKDSLPNKDIGVIVADVNDIPSLRAMCAQTRLVMNYAGPYELYGENVMSSCIEEKTHYADITGEVQWVTKMREKYDKRAKEQNVALISFCAYDCVPPEMSVYLASQELSKHTENVTQREVEYVTRTRGAAGFPRGTLLTLSNTFSKKPRVEDSFAYCGDEDVAKAAKSCFTSNHWGLQYSSLADSYTVPHVMALVNIPVTAHAMHGYNKKFPHTTFTDRTALPLFACFIHLFILYSLLLAFYIPPVRFVLTHLITKYYSYGGNPKVENELVTRVTEKDDKGQTQVVYVRFAFKGDPGIVATTMLSVHTLLALLEADLPSGFTTPTLACGNVLQKHLEAGGVEMNVGTEPMMKKKKKMEVDAVGQLKAAVGA